ncbi:hypothetical protein PM082_016516 [Marasmius tenuissimus]|nr:hypothetical protein PM082_016516 [Marasmius tenuissimus]
MYASYFRPLFPHATWTCGGRYYLIGLPVPADQWCPTSQPAYSRPLAEHSLFRKLPPSLSSDDIVFLSPDSFAFPSFSSFPTLKKNQLKGALMLNDYM